MDTNVPPKSTMRLVDALIKANKDFELLVGAQRQSTAWGVLTAPGDATISSSGTCWEPRLRLRDRLAGSART